jgi:LPXTG-motif cell wall-anchored protein
MKRRLITPVRTALAAAAIIVVALVSGGRAANAGGFCHEAMTDARGTSVHMKNNCMIPTVLRVDPGASVTFNSADIEPHTVTGSGYRDDRGRGSMDELTRGETVSFSFEESGVFPYFCVIHPGMIGTIVVGDGIPADAAVTSASLGVAAAEDSKSSAAPANDNDAGDSSSIALAASGAGVVALLVGLGAGALFWRRRMN